jgi:hypothetical protein
MEIGVASGGFTAGASFTFSLISCFIVPFIEFVKVSFTVLDYTIVWPFLIDTTRPTLVD